MAKEVMVDLKQKAEKITEEQLKRLQDVVSDINMVQHQIGVMETKKHNMMHQMGDNQSKLLDLQKEFEKDYGTFDVDINDGSIKYSDEQADS
jgi:precorrin isomerase